MGAKSSKPDQAQQPPQSPLPSSAASSTITLEKTNHGSISLSQSSPANHPRPSSENKINKSSKDMVNRRDAQSVEPEEMVEITVQSPSPPTTPKRKIRQLRSISRAETPKPKKRKKRMYILQPYLELDLPSTSASNRSNINRKESGRSRLRTPLISSEPNQPRKQERIPELPSPTQSFPHPDDLPTESFILDVELPLGIDINTLSDSQMSQLLEEILEDANKAMEGEVMLWDGESGVLEVPSGIMGRLPANQENALRDGLREDTSVKRTKREQSAQKLTTRNLRQHDSQGHEADWKLYPVTHNSRQTERKSDRNRQNSLQSPLRMAKRFSVGIKDHRAAKRFRAV